ncbi:MAG: VWA domain-containing protein [Blautia sp.]|nr:VWA domain-containing protein [Blautia sp.]
MVGRKKDNAIREIMDKVYRKKPWNRGVTAIAAVIVFITTYLLILPAITMTKDIVCGKEEHIHNDQCYETTYQRVLNCPYTQMGDGVIILHKHDENCYDTEGKLICPLQETEEHVHTAACYGVEEQDLFGSTAVEDGFGAGISFAPADEGFGASEGTDLFSSSAAVPPLCGMAELVPHTHTEECYDFYGNLICGKPEVIVHQHGEECFSFVPDKRVLICGKEEHVHDDSCYASKNEELPEEVGAVEDLFTGETAEENAVVVIDEIGAADDFAAAPEDMFGSETEEEIAGIIPEDSDNNEGSHSLAFFIGAGGEEAFEQAAAGEDLFSSGESENQEPGFDSGSDGDAALPAEIEGETVTEAPDKTDGGNVFEESFGESTTAEETTEFTVVETTTEITTAAFVLVFDEDREALAEKESESETIPGENAEQGEGDDAGEIIAEAGEEETTVESITEITSEVTTENTIGGQTTEFITEETSAEQSAEETTGESLTEPVAEITTEEVLVEQSTEVTTEATLVEQSTEITTEWMTGEQTTEVVTEVTSSDSMTEQTTEGRTEWTTFEALTEQTTEGKTEWTTFEPLTEYTTEGRTEWTTFEPVTELTTERATEWTTFEPSTEMTTEWTTVENSTEQTTEWIETTEYVEQTTAVLEYIGRDYKVRVTYLPASGIPAGARVEAEEIAYDSDEYAEYLAQAKSALGLDESKELPKEYARFFDIQIMAAGEDGEWKEIEPTGPVRVEIIYDQPVNVEGADTAAANIVHFDQQEEETKVEVLATIDATPNGENSEEANHVADTGVNEAENSQGDGTTGGEEDEESEDIDSLFSPEEDVNGNGPTQEVTDETDSEDASAVEGTEDKTKGIVSFETDSFSVYGVIYTVDFHYEINGKVYEFSIPGGGCATISQIVELLGIANKQGNTWRSAENEGNRQINDDAMENGDDGIDNLVEEVIDVSNDIQNEDGENAEGLIGGGTDDTSVATLTDQSMGDGNGVFGDQENTNASGRADTTEETNSPENSTDSTNTNDLKFPPVPLVISPESGENTDASGLHANTVYAGISSTTFSLDNVIITDETRDFVSDIANVEFSNSSLLWVGKVNDNTTIGQLKEANGLDVQYSAVLTEDDINALNSSSVEEGDWALISIAPFDTQETLTVTMKSGDVFTIDVTDALVDNDAVEDNKPYILYGVYTRTGQYYALRYNGDCYAVPGNNLDSLGDDFYWYHNSSDNRWHSGSFDNHEYYINLWYENLQTAIVRDWGSEIHMVDDWDHDGGYYFNTYSWDGNTYVLWLYYDYNSDPSQWRFVSGQGGNTGNGSPTYIYQKGEKHKLTIEVEDNSSNTGFVYIGDWVTEGQVDISSNGTNADEILAGVNLQNNYWFDHWELDGQIIDESENVRSFEYNGASYGWIAAGALTIGNEDNHVLKAVFVPETRFDVEVSPSEGGSTNVSSSARTKDGYNKEEINASAKNGYWFGHWEIDGEEVPESNYNIAEDGLSSTLPVHSLEIGDGECLTAVFIPQITYDVVAAPETPGASITGCTVQVGERAADSVPNNNMSRWGYNLENITANAGPGYVFKGWMLDDEPILGDAEIESALDGSTSKIKKGTLQVSPDGLSHVVKALFVQEYNFTVTTYPNGGGKVQDGDKIDGAAPTIFASMTKDGHNKYDITAIPNNGYSFLHWTMNGQPLQEGEGEEKHFLYTNGIIPEGELDLTSSDNICAVFVKNEYEIIVKNDTHGKTSIGNGTNDKTEKTCNTVNNGNEAKEAVSKINASPDSNYKFAYWKVGYWEWQKDSQNNLRYDENGYPMTIEYPNDSVIDWGEGYSVTSSTIQPKVNADTVLTAMFVSSNQRVFTVTVDDPSHGTVYGPDVSGNNVSNDAVGVTAYVAKTALNNNHQSNDGRPQVRTVASGYEFLGWNLYKSDGTTLVASYNGYFDNSLSGRSQPDLLKKWQLDNKSIWFDQDDMVLMAMFGPKEVPDAFEDDAMDALSEWAADIAGTKYLSDKEAEVFDYDNRIYRIKMSASSEKEAIDSSVVINFITDASRSMYFPATLNEDPDGPYWTGGYIEGNKYGEKLNNWLNAVESRKNNIYYFISNQYVNATVNTVWYDTAKRQWLYVDASYYVDNADDGMVREGNPVTGFSGTTNTDPTKCDDFRIYTADARVENKPWSRLDYLVMSVETAVKAIYEICPNAQIDLTTFNRSATYKGTLPNNAADIEARLRNLDVTGGTRQDLGLREAMDHFTEGSSKRQVAVLITDGAPNSGISDVKENVITSNASFYAGKLRSIKDAEGNNLELYTMGLSLDSTRQSFMNSLASGADYAKSVNSGLETSQAIQDIVNSLLTRVSLFGTITDTVDPAFYPVDKKGDPIKPGLYAIDGSKLTIAPQDNTPYYMWEVETKDGVDYWTITWLNQTMPWAIDEITPGWQNEFYVKAKEDFLGGNKINTNYGEDNGITFSGYVKLDTSIGPLNDIELKPFDYSPYVNVDELHIEGNETEWTVYLGTEVDPATQLIKLLKEIPVKQVVNKGGTDENGIYMVGADQMKYAHNSDAVDNYDDDAPAKGTSQILPLAHYVDFTSNNISTELTSKLAELSNHEGETTETIDGIKYIKKTVMVDNIVYDEYNHAAGKFTVTVTKCVNEAASVDGAPAFHETKLTGDAVETYTLSVQYTPYTDGASNSYDHTVLTGSAGQITNGAGKDEVKSENTHVINVIEKGIKVVKRDSATGEEILNNVDEVDRTAKFKLYRALKEGETSDKTIKVNEMDVVVQEVTELVTGQISGGSNSSDSAKIDSLPWYKAATSEYDGKYFLVEEEAPDGFLKITKSVVISLNMTNEYKDLDGTVVEEIDEIPYCQEQTVGIEVTFKGETSEIKETSGIFNVDVPNPPKGAMAVKKRVQTLDNASIEGMNGLYTFSSYGPVGSDEQFTYYLAFNVVNGQMTTYTFKKYEGAEADPDESQPIETKTGSVTDQNLGYLIDDIETGIYAMEEHLWVLENNMVHPDDIYLKDITLEPASGGNTTDVFKRTTSVYVTAQNTAEDPLKVTFINEYAPERDQFGVQKVWQKENGTEMDPNAPWDERISVIEFSVSQTNSENETNLLTFRTGTPGAQVNTSRLLIQRYGRTARVSPSERGSTVYDLEWVTGGNQWETFISGLEKKDPDGNPYTYKIEEISIRDVFGSIVTGYETTYDLSKDNSLQLEGELITEGGKNVGIKIVNDEATAFINNKKIEEAELNLKKILEVSEEKPLCSDLTMADGSYTFTVSGPEGAEKPITKYVKINAQSTDNGENANPRFTTAYTFQIGDTIAERDAMSATAVVDGGVPIQGLTPGKYTITETGWSISTSSHGGFMYLKDIDVSSGSNNETDLSEKVAEVYAGEGEVGSLVVEFTNALKPYPGIQIEKIDEFTRPADKTTKFLSGAEFEIRKWSDTNSNYLVYPNEPDSKAVTQGDGRVVFIGIEPGEYKIIETVTPTGYVKLVTNDIFINVAYNESSGLHTITRYKEAYNGNNTSRTVVSESENVLGVTFAQATIATSATLTVGNELGAALPATGGSGTTLFYLIGVLLTTLAGGGVVMKRRKVA